MNLEPIRHLAGSLGCVYAEGEALSKHVTLRIGGPALFYLRPPDWRAAEVLLLALWKGEIPFRVLGGGSNLLVPDGALPYGVLHVKRLGGEIRWAGPKVEADADVPMPALASDSVRRGFAGLEGMGGVPGTVGGAVVMNAGAFGNDVARILKDVALIEKGRGLVWHPASDFTFGYRHTDIPARGVIAACRFALTPGDPSALAARFDEVKVKRNATQPWTQPTAGSVFKNPSGDHAGRILEALGFKGRRRGDVGFSDLHANFLVNHGAGTFADAWALCEEARAAASEKGHRLEYEMEVWP
jgi:UDP-N-acetylmuramate dehydrogenase